MRILIIKTSSMGDILHLLPALTDAGKYHPKIQFDWVVEESFAEIPKWHPLVKKVIPIALRRWRRAPWQAIKSGEWRQFRKNLRAEHYNYVIDAQGLMKSAIITRMAKGLRCGLDHLSAWEMFASIAYEKTVTVQPEQHAVIRMRQLFAQVLGYPCPETVPIYGIAKEQFAPILTSIEKFYLPEKPFLLFFHGTTWKTKHWPVEYWQSLLNRALAAGYVVFLPWGNPHEFNRATMLAKDQPNAIVLPKLKLIELASLLSHANGAVAVDTGLGHLAAALGVRTLSIYGPTNPLLTGTQGLHQEHFKAIFSCAPCLGKTCTFTGSADISPACFSTVSPHLVWQKMQSLLTS